MEVDSFPKISQKFDNCPTNMDVNSFPLMSSMKLHGIDFTSAPSRRKAITIATGVVRESRFILESLTSLHDFDTFEQWLCRPGPWLGVFDMPFSLPRELVSTLGWPLKWAPLMAHFASLTRPQIRTTFKTFCDARADGNKFAHRDTEALAGASSSMKWVNPPVAYMLHAGVPRLIRAGITLYGLHSGDPERVAMEGYPGLVARSITRASYKHDDTHRQTNARRVVRIALLERLQAGDYPLGIRLDAGQHVARLIDDAKGDLLDSVICGLLAAWAWQRRTMNFGLPDFDPLEGWIVGA